MNAFKGTKNLKHPHLG